MFLGFGDKQQLYVGGLDQYQSDGADALGGRAVIIPAAFNRYSRQEQAIELKPLAS